MNQMRVLVDRRFWPMFWTQFLGAFNDNLFKNALVILIAYKSMKIASLGSEQLVALSAGVFILPFFLFSATAGQIADKISKSRLMRWVKAVEIGVMGLAAVGFVTDNLMMLLVVLFFMGLQSTFFGPAKYSVLPELVDEDELVGSNALVEMGTFVAILLGTIAGGVLIALEGVGPVVLAVGVVVVAGLGWLTSLYINETPPGDPHLRVNLNPVTPTVQTYRATRHNRAVFLSVLGISWFWFLGASFLTVLPTYTKDVLRGSEHVVTFLLALFCVGIALGSLMCERLSGRKLELGLVPFGSIGISVFALDLFLAGDPWGEPPAAALVGLGTFLEQPGAWRIAVDLTGLSIFSGFYTVPLYTMIQQRTEAETRSRVIAGNNILNAFFMVGSSLMLVGLFALDVTVPQIFGVLALLNAVVAMYIYTVIPEFLLRFVAWMIAKVAYRVRVTGVEHIPHDGAAVLVCNHVTFIDWLIVASTCSRPPRFVMYHKFFDIPVVGFLFRDAKVIPIAPAHEDEETLSAAFDKIAAELAEGELVCIFPEGKLTKHGKLNVFRTGIERIIERTPVPVIPMALSGMWGSFFSHHGGMMKRPFQRFWSRVSLTIGAPVDPADVSAADLGERVAALGGWEPPPLEAPKPAVQAEPA